MTTSCSSFDGYGELRTWADRLAIGRRGDTLARDLHGAGPLGDPPTLMQYVGGATADVVEPVLRSLRRWDFTFSVNSWTSRAERSTRNLFISPQRSGASLFLPGAGRRVAISEAGVLFVLQVTSI